MKRSSIGCRRSKIEEYMREDYIYKRSNQRAEITSRDASTGGKTIKITTEITLINVRTAFPSGEEKGL